MDHRAGRGIRGGAVELRAKASLVVLVLVCLLSPSGVVSAQQLPAINFTADDGLSHSQVWSVFQDSRGYLWVGTSDGLNRFDTVSFSVFRTRDGLHNPTVRTTVEDADGNLWFGTDSGVSMFDGRRFTSYSEADGLGKGIIWASVRDQFGRLW
ncbi:MAG: ligand-binding sensor domain-containing protein, partial [Thermoanaerobaculia bacterium]